MEGDYVLSPEARKALMTGKLEVVASDLEKMEEGQICIVSHEFAFKDPENYDSEDIKNLGRKIKEALKGSGENYKVDVIKREDRGGVFFWDYLVVKRVS